MLVDALHSALKDAEKAFHAVGIYVTTGVHQETGGGTLAFGGPAFNARGSASHGGGVMSFGGMSFVGAGGRHETATGTMAFRGFSFNSSGVVAHTGGGVMAFRGVSIVAGALNVGTPGSGLRQFWTF
jgi:hypothetical protein